MKREQHKVAQGGLHPLRIGRFTASIAGKLFMGKATAGYNDIVNAVAAERFTGQRLDDGIYTPYMARGHEMEPYAVEQYELETFREVLDGGFWTCGDWYGASPDGLVGADGVFEGKAPKFTTHIRYLRDGKLPKDYTWQPHMQMFVTDRNWCDFQSYHPELPTFRIRVHRDDKTEQKLLHELELAQELAEQIINDLGEYNA